ncbi:MAG TPA: hypothetical protein VFQ23_00200 [Anaerolineales bacterium]|nr:hypothetical protein [Anaerolineales bacterium]
MKTTNKFWLATCLLIFLAACSGEPKFINHPAPNLSVSFDAFNNDESLNALGCDEIQIPSDLLGGLDPSYPIAICAIRPDEVSEELRAEIDSGQFFYYTGGLFGNYIRYVIYQNGEFLLIKTAEDFRRIFAPIESSQEALSYVLAVKNLSAYYGLKHDPAYKYEVNTIEDTYITPDSDGFLVHLFHEQVFGCGPHWTSEVDVRVSVEGNVEEVASQPILRDPNLDDLCVD